MKRKVILLYFIAIHHLSDTVSTCKHFSDMESPLGSCGRQKKREHDLTSSLSLSGRVHMSVWQPTFIRQQCNHQEMPGKCFNLPILIQNARTLNQAAQTYITEIPCHSTGPRQHVFVKYLLHTVYNEKHTPCFNFSALKQGTRPLRCEAAQRPTVEDCVWTGQFLRMTACDCGAGRYCKRAHVLSTALPG
uniref:Uncharacterized protein n=1 Tax=Lates calcarifer TaxID=8187 RepID=A0A4W6EMZ0_LATCA